MMCSYRGGGGGSQETYSVRLEKKYRKFTDGPYEGVKRSKYNLVGVKRFMVYVQKSAKKKL